MRWNMNETHQLQQQWLEPTTAGGGSAATCANTLVRWCRYSCGGGELGCSGAHRADSRNFMTWGGPGCMVMVVVRPVPRCVRVRTKSCSVTGANLIRNSKVEAKGWLAHAKGILLS